MTPRIIPLVYLVPDEEYCPGDGTFRDGDELWQVFVDTKTGLGYTCCTIRDVFVDEYDVLTEEELA